MSRVDRRGRFFALCGPSGVGKTSILEALLREVPRLTISPSYTTRPPRPGEVRGKYYHFVPPDKFAAMRSAHEFLECAQYFNHWYGTSHADVSEKLSAGFDVIKEMDVQGVRQVRRRRPSSEYRFVPVLVLPPSLGELHRRLTDRGTEDSALRAKRLALATDELAQAAYFDYLVINRKLRHAIDTMRAIIGWQRSESAVFFPLEQTREVSPVLPDGHQS